LVGHELWHGQAVSHYQISQEEQKTMNAQLFQRKDIRSTII
jgi:hypothetical protein